MTRRSAEAEVWQELRELVLERHDRRRDVADELGMSYVRVKAMVHLSRANSTMRELGTALGIDPPYTTVVVDDLEQRGLVRRLPHPEDRRAKLVEITADGRVAARRAQRISGAAPASVKALSDHDLAELHRITARLLTDEP